MGHARNRKAQRRKKAHHSSGLLTKTTPLCPSCGKLSYADQREAERQARKTSARKGIDFSVYQCRDTGAFHLTSQPRNST